MQEPIVIDATYEEVKTIRLNLGCNEQLIEGWHNIEMYPKPSVADKVRQYDVSDLNMYADNSVDEILASHIIEHFTYWQAKDKVLKEWNRVLKPGGKISIETPDFFNTCKRFVDGSFDKFGLYGQFFAYACEPGQVHYFLYTEEQLAWTLEVNGFTGMQRVFPDSSYAQKTPGFEDLFLKMIAFKK